MSLTNMQFMPKFKGFLMLNVRFQLKENAVQNYRAQVDIGKPHETIYLLWGEAESLVIFIKDFSGHGVECLKDDRNPVYHYPFLVSTRCSFLYQV